MKLFISKSCVLVGALSAFAAADSTVVSTVTTAKASASVETSTVKKTQITKGEASASPKAETASNGSMKSSSTEVVEVEAIGCGDDHVTAMSDACTQAVSQVCGADVAKAIVTAGNKSAQVGGTVFAGVLISYSVVEDVKSEDGSYTVKIKAKVKPPVTDIFSDKIALVLPDTASIHASLSKGKLSPTTVDALASIVEDCIKSTISGDERFVILDRSSSLAHQERHFAGTSQTSRLEKGKADSMKAADFVLELKMLKGDEKMSAKEFKTAKRSKYTLAVNMELELRLVDVASGGVLSREVISVECSGTSWREEKCTESVSESVQEKCASAMQEKLDALFSKVE